MSKHARYVAAYEAVRELRAKGVDIAEIARHVGVSRRTAYRYLSLDGPPERKRPVRRPSPERLAWEAYITRRWEEGCRNGRRLWREARAAGLRCGERNVARFVARLRQQGAQRRPTSTSSQTVTSVQGPTARHVAVLFLRRPSSLSTEQATYLEHLCQRDATIGTAYALAQDFVHMLREREGDRLDAWVAATVDSGSPSCAASRTASWTTRRPCGRASACPTAMARLRVRSIDSSWFGGVCTGVVSLICWSGVC